MEKLPFKMIILNEIEQWRHDTFWIKEPETIEWIKSFKNGDVFFDVGANIGIYSLYCAAIHPNSRVCAFEPHPVNFQRLLDNVFLNKFETQIKVHNYMIAEGDCFRNFEFASNKAGSSGGQMLDSQEFGYACKSIDDLVIFGFDFPDPTHIKIDIDGQELKVVLGMLQTLNSKKLKSVLIEIENDKLEIIDIFYAAGFTRDNMFNKIENHSRVRRQKEGIHVENIVFTRG